MLRSILDRNKISKMRILSLLTLGILGVVGIYYAETYMQRFITNVSPVSGTPHENNPLAAVSAEAAQSVEYLPLEGLDWLYDRYPDFALDQDPGFSVATFTPSEYDSLMTAAVQGDESGLRALKYSIYKHLQERPNDREYAGIKQQLYSESFLAKVDLGLIADLIPPYVFEEDKQLSLAIIKKNPHYLKLLPLRVRADKEVVTEAALADIATLNYGAMSLLRDPEFAIEFLALRPDSLSYFPWELTRNRESALTILREYPDQFQAVDPDLRSDPEILKIIRTFLLSTTGEFSVPAKLYDDHDFAAELLARNPKELKWFSEGVRGDKKIVVPLLQKHPEQFEHISAAIQNDPDILPHLRAMLIKEPFKIINYPEAFRGNRGFAKELLGVRGDVLPHLPDEVKKDKELVGIALRKYPHVYWAADPAIQNAAEVLPLIREFLLHANNLGSDYLPEKLRNDRAVVLKVVSLNCGILQHASAELRDDEEIVRAAVKNSPRCITYASERLKSVSLSEED